MVEELLLIKPWPLLSGSQKEKTSVNIKVVDFACLAATEEKG
jgi:hypothetical protein